MTNKLRNDRAGDWYKPAVPTPTYQVPSPFGPLGSATKTDQDRLKAIALLQAQHQAEVLEKQKAEEIPPAQLRIWRPKWKS